MNKHEKQAVRLFNLPALPTMKEWRSMNKEERCSYYEANEAACKAAGLVPLKKKVKWEDYNAEEGDIVLLGIGLEEVYEVFGLSRKSGPSSVAKAFRYGTELPDGTWKMGKKVPLEFVSALSRDSKLSLSDLNDLPLNVVKALIVGWARPIIARRKARAKSQEILDKDDEWALTKSYWRGEVDALEHQWGVQVSAQYKAKVRELEDKGEA